MDPSGSDEVDVDAVTVKGTLPFLGETVTFAVGG